MGHQYMDALLHISVDPIDTICVFSGLGHVYGVLKSISSPRHAGLGTFYITVMLEGASWACRYLLHIPSRERISTEGTICREECIEIP